MKLTRRTMLTAAAAAVVAPRAGFAALVDKPITLLHGFGAGGSADGVARILAENLSKKLGRSVVVEAKPGAGGTIASREVAKSAKPDGATLVFLTGGHSVAAAIYNVLPYDTLKDFTYIGLAGYGGPFVLFANAQNPVKTTSEVIKLAKEKPGMLTFGSSGVGTTGHLSMALMMSMAGIQMEHIPYKDSAQPGVDLAAGRVDFVIANLGSVKAHIQSGKIKAIGVTSAERFIDLSDTHAFAEDGVKGYDVTTYYGIAGPAGLPDDVVATINKALGEIMADTAVAEKLRPLTTFPLTSTPKEYYEQVAMEIQKWSGVVQTAAIPKM
ncbi:tripartite tricarboxylate transporter substrate binding protein [Agrobacterium tumefaciens]|uniref:tripartite tricarboxylate transporter substrate-binding protein n=1 Tax=Agrobacterium tumefaciens TaxID=358 RepID=UPI0012B8BD8F|nr:tripartite tricarboxylate transporter substrate-binding protein [Agrobacterium tumefaciens]MQB07246.1 tripartite tricarboxylate transporter substrate binding protein [Agrobacterium tumefaciens]